MGHVEIDRNKIRTRGNFDFLILVFNVKKIFLNLVSYNFSVVCGAFYQGAAC